MRAVIWTRYGPPDVLELREVVQPVPKDQEVLIKVRASTVTAGDCEMRSLKFPLYLSFPMRLFIGFRKPTRVTIPGMEFSGEIESTGKEVSAFKPGDQVFGTAGFRMGAYADYLCMPADPGETEGLLIKKPDSISHEEAAVIPVGGLEAWHFLKKAGLQPGETILINGAGGSIGTFAVQIAKNLGAEVTAVDSTGKLDMLRSIGADRVVDYTKEDFTRQGDSYHVIFDVAGKSDYTRSIEILKPGGCYLLANPGISQLLRKQFSSPKNSKKIITGTANYKPEDLVVLRDWVQAGIIKSVIDRHFPLDQIVEAHRYVETGQKKGSVVISMVT